MGVSRVSRPWFFFRVYGCQMPGLEKKEVKDQVIWETLNWPWFHCEPSKKQECLRKWVLTGRQGIRPVPWGGSPSSSSSSSSACLLLLSSKRKTRFPLLEPKLALWLLWPTKCGEGGILVLLGLSLKTSFHFLSRGIFALEAFRCQVSKLNTLRIRCLRGSPNWPLQRRQGEAIGKESYSWSATIQVLPPSPTTALAPAGQYLTTAILETPSKKHLAKDFLNSHPTEIMKSKWFFKV